jgi:hypothetical protein
MNPNDDPKPVKPTEPHPNECCNSGCDPCVYDMYFAELQAYEQALKRWQERQQANPGKV